MEQAGAVQGPPQYEPWLMQHRCAAPEQVMPPHCHGDPFYHWHPSTREQGGGCPTVTLATAPSKVRKPGTGSVGQMGTWLPRARLRPATLITATRLPINTELDWNQ